MKITVKALVEAFLKTPKERSTNQRGNQVYYAFLSSERYVVDFADDYKEEGWEQFDTDQDAPYFGVWVNRNKLMTLTYAEGDWVVVVCPDKDHYNEEIRNAIEFYGEGFIAKAVDRAGAMTVYRQDRQKFLIT